jgi:hypothetical protein
MSIIDFVKAKIFNADKKKDLEWCVQNGLITFEEKLRLEADRTTRRLEKYVAKKEKKRKH